MTRKGGNYYGTGTQPVGAYPGAGAYQGVGANTVTCTYNQATGTYTPVCSNMTNMTNMTMGSNMMSSNMPRPSYGGGKRKTRKHHKKSNKKCHKKKHNKSKKH